jgi:hypothetical protein
VTDSIQDILDTPVDGGGDVTSSLDTGGGEAETGLAGDSVAEAALAAEEAAQATDEQPGELEAANPDGEEGAEGEESAEDEGAPELHRVKVDGHEYEVDLDELKAGYSRGRASTKRFQEAAAKEKAVQGFVAELRKGDPDMIGALFQKIGLDFDAIAEAHLSRKLEELQLPEAQRGMRELQRERALLERERQAFQAQSREAQIQRESEQILARIQSETEAALTRHGFTPSPALFAQAAHLMEQSLNAGYQMSPEEAVTNIKESLMALPRDALARVVGGDKADSMRREAGQAAAAQSKQRAAKAAKPAASSGPDLSSVGYISTDRMDDIKRLFDM